MENNNNFILATCLKGGKFEISDKQDMQMNSLSEFIEAAELWPTVSPGGEALVIDKNTMEIMWPERLKGKKVEAWY